MSEMIKKRYQQFESALSQAKKRLGRDQLTLAEKILFVHEILESPDQAVPKRGEGFWKLQPDRVAMQDATAQMAILQFMQANRDTVAVPSTVHCDHLIRAQSGAEEDLARAVKENEEVYRFLKSAAARYGMGFWQPGSGIIHQVVLEKYAFPGGLMIGTDSHTPNAGGLGMLAIGVGGADAADTMAGLPWEVKAPKLIGVHLTGQLNGWTAPKDVILYVLGKLSTKGGTNKIVEYFGPGAESISCTGKATITNMGAELGATTSVFPFDERMAKYLEATERADVAQLAREYADCLKADPDVLANPKNYFDEILEINLSELEPHIVGPHSPDKARPISKMAEEVKAAGFPDEVKAALIGSCTNSSYEDMERAAHVARQAAAKGIKSKSYLLISPGSEQIYQTIQRDGQMQVLNDAGAVVLTNSCGPCIGNWDRTDIKAGQPNSIVSSFNRNFPKRNDGNPDTLSFITSPEIVMAFALSGSLSFNPITDTIDGIKLEPPVAPELPPAGFAFSAAGFVEAPANGKSVEVDIAPTSTRLEKLKPFTKWDGQDFTSVPILVKTKGQTTTDHISPAGKDWLPLRGHLSGIAHNMLLGAVDAETGEPAAAVKMVVCGIERGASPWALKAMEYRDQGQGSIIVGDENYGEGSSREHAAMCPRLLGVKAVIARSFARIHETNLKKQGILPLTFSNAADYDKVRKGDKLDIKGLSQLTAGKPVECVIHQQDGSQVTISLSHSLSAEQIGWFKAGSAMNAVNQPVTA